MRWHSSPMIAVLVTTQHCMLVPFQIVVSLSVTKTARCRYSKRGTSLAGTKTPDSATATTTTATTMPSKPAVPPTPEALLSLVTRIPPKTLHAYVLAHISDAPPDTLASLASFFSTLKPPPLLHCVRCHTDYREVDNDNRSCCVAHDDYGGNIEWIGGIGRNGSEYETHYNCCGKTVEGEGDEGPPPGWCYEGMHTVSLSDLFSIPTPPPGDFNARPYT